MDSESLKTGGGQNLWVKVFSEDVEDIFRARLIENNLIAIESLPEIVGVFEVEFSRDGITVERSRAWLSRGAATAELRPHEQMLEVEARTGLDIAGPDLDAQL